MAAASEPFYARNGIVANSDFTANSTVVTLGSNVSLNTSALSVSGAVLNSTSFTGQANSALYVGSIPAASVVTAASLAANLSSYEGRANLESDVFALIPSYSGVINASSLSVGSGSVTANSSAVTVGNTAIQFHVGYNTVSGFNSFGNVVILPQQIYLYSSSAPNTPFFSANNFGVYHTGTVQANSLGSNSLSVGSNSVQANSSGLFVNGSVTTAQVGIQPVSNSSYTLVPSDSGKALWVSNSSVATVTVSNSLPVGFRCLLIQGSANVQIANSAGVSLLSRTGSYGLTAQYSSASVLVPFAGSAVIDGSI